MSRKLPFSSRREWDKSRLGWEASAVVPSQHFRQSRDVKQGSSVGLGSLATLAIALLAQSALAAPPPPVRTPPALDQPVNGYDMRVPFQLWRYWVESRKGPVTEALLAEAEDLAGLEHFGRLLRFQKSNDFGHYLTGEIRAYCQPTHGARYTPIAGSCVYVLRRAYVPLDAATYGEPNPLSEWTRTNFDAEELAAHFRKIGLGPSTDWWFADREAMFATTRSPRAVLIGNAVVIRLDSTECPQMKAAIAALEGRALGASVDFVAVGKDDHLQSPNPHSIRSNFIVYLHADGGAYTVEGWAGPAARMATPILDAADTCERTLQRGVSSSGD